MNEYSPVIQIQIVSENSIGQIQTSFAFALIKLDGADTAMLHMISDCEKSDLTIGNRVKAVWSETPTESIADIQHFILDI